MEWLLDVNEILKDDITKITNSLIPPGFVGDVRSIRRMQQSLSRLVDALGELSAAEQGLSKVITTAEKLRTADAHTLYVMRDAAARDGKGEVVGMLKVGRKHLFLYDAEEAVREVEPLCVLDFYVVRSRQRRGCGKELFDYMLRDMDITPHQLAVDGPSDKMERFLAKNYGVRQLMRHTNNFAISPRFFQSLPPHQLLSKSGASTPSGAQGAVGRYTAHKPHSSIGNVIHGGGGASAVTAATAAAMTAAAAAAAHVPHHTDGSTGSGSGSVPAPGPEAAPRPRSLPVPVPEAAVAAAAVAPLPAPAQTPAGAPGGRDPQLTDKGFFDVKFHHKKLCKSGASTPSGAQGAVGRYTAHKPHSSIGNVIHCGGGASAVTAAALTAAAEHVPHHTDGKSGASTPSGAQGAVGRYTAHKPHSSIGNVIYCGGGASAVTAAAMTAAAEHVPHHTDG